MARDVVGLADEALPGRPLLVPAMREGELVLDETIERMRHRASAELGALPDRFRRLDAPERQDPYPVELSPRLRDEAVSLGA